MREIFPTIPPVTGPTSGSAGRRIRWEEESRMKRSRFLNSLFSAALLTVASLGMRPAGAAPAVAKLFAVPTGPLSPADPRSQLDPALRFVAPMPDPQEQQNLAPLPAGVGEREVL